MSKRNRRLKLAALGLMLLGLWEMLALMQGASAGREAGYRMRQAPGRGETPSWSRPLAEAGFVSNGATRKALPLCKGNSCWGIEKPLELARLDNASFTTASFDNPVDDGADDATSAIGPRGGQQASPSDFAPAGPTIPFSPESFGPGRQFGFSPGIASLGAPFAFAGPSGASSQPGETQASEPAAKCQSTSRDLKQPELISGDSGCGTDPDSLADSTMAQNSDGLPPPDFTEPPFSDLAGGSGAQESAGAVTGVFTVSDDTEASSPGSNGPDGSSGPNGDPAATLDPPIELPEPVTLGIFAMGLAGTVLTRRRAGHSR